jgi:23S rRNA (cytidine1920-2'-O)/16S rRNA (cytidine1409-2'-O)-methyltransferase
VVSDPALHVQAVRDVAWAAQREQGYAVLAVAPSPITGAEGNREFFLHLRREGAAVADAALEAMVQKAVAP